MPSAASVTPLRATQSSADQPDVSVELITPEKALEYLGANAHNRTLRIRQVAAYADDLRNGRWTFNGDPIRFDLNGELIDGQHRLHAIIEAAMPVQMIVLRGLRREQMDSIDTGLKRSFADVLKLRGEKNVAQLATVVRAVAVWKQTGTIYHSNISTPALLEELERTPEMRECVGLLGKANRGARLSYIAGGYCWWRFQKIDAESAEFFFERLSSDEGHYKGQPLYALRRALLQNESGDPLSRALHPVTQAAITIKAWNKWRTGETCSILKYRPGGVNPEEFPEPV